MRRTTAFSAAFILIISIVAYAAVHPPINRPRHLQSELKRARPRRAGPYPTPPKPATLLSKAVDLGYRAAYGRPRTIPSRDVKGPGQDPAYLEATAARGMDVRLSRPESRRRKRQTNMASGTATSSAPASTSTGNGTAPVWVLDDAYLGYQFFK